MKRHSCGALGALGMIGMVSCGNAGEAGDAQETASLALGSLSQALSDPAAVFGFENVADFTVTQGTKASSSDHSQGQASLGVSNFTFTTILTPPLSTLPGITDEIRHGYDSNGAELSIQARKPIGTAPADAEP